MLGTILIVALIAGAVLLAIYLLTPAKHYTTTDLATVILEHV